ASYLLNDTTGYIRLNKFSESTYEEFMEALEKLKNKGIRKLVLDLRDNGGGILDEAVQIADEFLSGEKLIVYTEGAHHQRREYHARRKGLFEEGSLILLMDEGSASASEVLAGALQDWDRATIIGRRSFGKGLVQEQYSLEDGSALRLTVARYYTPLGRSIQKPYNNGINEYNSDIINRYYHGELIHADSLQFKKGVSFKTQSGKNLYGGGGINPDIFISIDTTKYDTVFNKIYVKNTISNYAYHYFLEHQLILKKFNDPSEYNMSFQIDETLMADFKSYAKKDSIEINNLKKSNLLYLATRIKASIARQIWRMDGYFQVINFKDPAIEKAVKL
ncbi:MAG: S41 family peptidase, partial [Chitinophagaceae bacterium]